LEFTSLALRTNLSNPTEELSTSFSNAYSKTLGKHHSFMIRPVFSLAMSACPSRDNFYKQLAKGEDVKKAEQQLNDWLTGLENRLQLIVAFYVNEKLA
jgi:uncharacterized secreted protein with C-terminal beta-propeller domain